ncbi:MAG: hypothetical protein ACXW6T_25415, partial [Candidatus Binatia bacterium]
HGNASDLWRGEPARTVPPMVIELAAQLTGAMLLRGAAPHPGPVKLSSGIEVTPACGRAL